ncbi:MAG TPA: YetF domain-containing protein [Acidimicrobiales bacterium]|nr:YetF domain-containing protein [Acidimicrobiales bacterium]
MEIVVRATAIFGFIWLVMRGVGKRRLSEMTGFELILLILMGDLVQQGLTQDDRSVTGAFLAVGTIAFWVWLLGFVGFKWPASRNVIEGVPVVVVRDGRVLAEALRNEELPLEELLQGARKQGIQSLDDVAYAILEPDGTLSFLRAPTPGDEPRGGGEQRPKGG